MKGWIWLLKPEAVARRCRYPDYNRKGVFFRAAKIMLEKLTIPMKSIEVAY
jgi:hypothetical protein